MIRFAVLDESNQLIGQRFLPIEFLNAGYRHIVLRDQWNQPLGLPTLFVHIVSAVYVPKEALGKCIPYRLVSAFPVCKLSPQYSIVMNFQFFPRRLFTFLGISSPSAPLSITSVLVSKYCI